jgi:hypothetical protein
MPPIPSKTWVLLVFCTSILPLSFAHDLSSMLAFLQSLALDSKFLPIMGSLHLFFLYLEHSLLCWFFFIPTVSFLTSLTFLRGPPQLSHAVTLSLWNMIPHLSVQSNTHPTFTARLCSCLPCSVCHILWSLLPVMSPPSVYFLHDLSPIWNALCVCALVLIFLSPLKLGSPLLCSPISYEAQFLVNWRDLGHIFEPMSGIINHGSLSLDNFGAHDSLKILWREHHCFPSKPFHFL